MRYETIMNGIWKELPDDITNEILSYGDPAVTHKHYIVMKQISYYAREFTYHRTNHYKPFCRWYGVLESDYFKYALREVFLKKHVNKYYGDLNMNYHSNPPPRFMSVTYMNRTIDIPTRKYV